MERQRINRDGNRYVENGRLVYYQRTANQGFWEEVWENVMSPEYYKPFQDGILFNFDRMFKIHLRNIRMANVSSSKPPD